MIYIHILYFRGDGGPLERCSGGVSVSRENGVVTSIHQGAHRAAYIALQGKSKKWKQIHRILVGFRNWNTFWVGFEN